MDFSQIQIQKNINEIFFGPQCEAYLNNLVIEDHIEAVVTIRQNCLQFYITVAKEIRKRLPITHNFLIKLQMFDPSIFLFDNNRETSFQHVSFIAKNLGGFDEESLRKEWLALPTKI